LKKNKNIKILAIPPAAGEKLRLKILVLPVKVLTKIFFIL